MKVILLNGSPHKEGCTDTALREVEGSLMENGIETERIWIGGSAWGCTACGACTWFLFAGAYVNHYTFYWLSELLYSLVICLIWKKGFSVKCA